MWSRYSDKEIEVNKAELLTKLKSNLETHIAEHKEAMKGYREAVVEALEHKLRDAKMGRDVSHELGLERPESHEKTFRRAIQLIELDVGKTFTITVGDMDRFINNEWEWSEKFATVNALYTKIHRRVKTNVGGATTVD